MKTLYAIFIGLFVCTASAESPLPWLGHQAAVSLTYDDSVDQHLDVAVPALDKYGFLGTFYITGYFDGFRNRLGDWRAVVKTGHELGNHTIFHPCEGGRVGREWVSADRDLTNWSNQRIAENVAFLNTALEAVDGKKERTFAYPCGDMTAEGKTYLDKSKPTFVGARAVGGSPPKVHEVNLMGIHSQMISGNSAESMIAMVDEAIKNKTWLVFLFHGVGGGHGLDVGAKEHQALLEHLNKKKQQVWVAPVVDVARFVKNQQNAARKEPISSD